MKSGRYRLRRVIGVLSTFILVALWVITNPESYQPEKSQASSNASAESQDAPLVITILETLPIKGRAPKTGYKRTEFYDTWPIIDGCSLRQRIIKREVGDSAKLDGCDVVAGTFTEAYTGETREYKTKAEFSKNIQIDHIVALSDAWQKGAQNLTKEKRYELATDPLNLIAADGPANQQKSDGDAATWLPKNKAFRCQYVARQVSVKSKYELWVTQAEHDAIARVLTNCPDEKTVGLGK
ncbi:MAG: HNH endonuclease family protein [Candidatus Saccharibacteria bacterium]|nr:HNH endonuclease family protein [Candidatus Saccharibacteria bacterium]